MIGALSPGRTLLGIPWYSLLIVSAILVAVWLCSKEEKRLMLPKDTTIDLALWLIPCGIIGARLYYVAFEWDQFAPDPLSILYVWEGGIAIYGAILGGLLAAFLFAHKRKLSLPVLADMIFPTVALAQAIGRWGNYFNMEAYGESIRNPALQFFPFGVLIPNGSGYAWHLATFFYESVWDLGVFIVLWKTRKSTYRPGDTALWYLLLYGPGRCFIEGLRMDSLYAGGGIRISQWLSIAGCMAACTVFLIRSLKSIARTDRWSLILSYSPGVLGALALMMSLGHIGPLWLRSIPAVLSLLALAIRQHKRLRWRVWAVILFQIVQLFSLWNESALDPLLFKTIQFAACGLTFTAVGWLIYPDTALQKEGSLCGI